MLRFFCFGNSKIFSQIKQCVRNESFADFQWAFRGSPLKLRLGTAVPTVDEKIKNAENPRFFRALSVGASAPNPDTKDFS